MVQPERHHLVEAFQRPEKFQQCEVRGRQEVEDGQLKREQLPNHRDRRDADNARKDDKKDNKVQKDKNSKNKETENTAVEKDVDDNYSLPQLKHATFLNKQDHAYDFVQKVVRFVP